MSMHQGLDLSKFKRVSGDKASTTLRHSKGHEIKIAHAAMSPKMKQQIDKMPMYLAEGTPDGPVEAPEDEAGAEEEPAEEPDVPAGEPAAPAPPEEAAASAPPKPVSDRDVPESNTFNVLGQRKVPTTQELDNEDALFAQDLQRGHIKPETYQDLFAKRDTLGKIGTIFGLIVGGAGAGLSGQPNALMGMMQKEIDNDLEAQKTSNANAQNWLRLSQQHEMNKAQLQRYGVENELTRAQIGKIPSEIESTKAATKSHLADAELKAVQTAKTRMTIAAYQKLLDDVNKMPPGPSKDAASGLLSQTIGPEVMNGVAKTNAQTVDVLKSRAALRGEADEDAPPIDLNKFNKLVGVGQMGAQLGMPGGFVGSDKDKATSEAEKVIDNRAFYKIWKDSFEKLDKAFAGGVLNPQMRKAEIATLGAQVARETAGRFNQAEATAQADAMFPSPKDWGNARNEKFRKGVEYFAGNEKSTPTLDRFQLKSGFPYPAGAQKKGGTVAEAEKPKSKAEAPKKAEEKKMTSKSGKPMTLKNGKWTYDK